MLYFRMRDIFSAFRRTNQKESGDRSDLIPLSPHAMWQSQAVYLEDLQWLQWILKAKPVATLHDGTGVNSQRVTTGCLSVINPKQPLFPSNVSENLNFLIFNVGVEIWVSCRETLLFLSVWWKGIRVGLSSSPGKAGGKPWRPAWDESKRGAERPQSGPLLQKGKLRLEGIKGLV